MPRYLTPPLTLPQLLSIVANLFELPLFFHDQDVADFLGFIHLVFELVPYFVIVVLLEFANFHELRLAHRQKHNLLLHLYFNYRKAVLKFEVLHPYFNFLCFRFHLSHLTYAKSYC